MQPKQQEAESAPVDEFAQADARWWRREFVAPTPEALLTHANRFGVEGVNETASVFGVEMGHVGDEEMPKRHRRTGPTVRQQVLELHGRGAVVAAIADTLNIADRRVKDILAHAAA
jgi:hypothetical protein